MSIKPDRGRGLPTWTAAVHKEVLPNGLTLLVQPNDSAPVVAVVTRVQAGFFDEPDHWAGISHVLEHMFFKGTPSRGVGEIARDTKQAGGYLNASTTYDHTTYYTVLPASSLATALAVQSDALRHSLIDADELARELRVIVEEAKRKLDTPSAVTYETLYQVMFDAHRIRRWRIGLEEDLVRFTRDDLVGYYRSRYVPERTVVSIVGALDVAETLALSRQYYGDWPAARGAVDPSPEEPVRREVRARTLRGDVSRAELAIGWRTVPTLHPHTPALDVAAAILSSGRGSWLHRGLREPGIVTGISASNHSPTELGVFGISATLAPAQLSRAIAGIAEATMRLATLGPTSDDLERSLTLLQGRWARGLESMEGRASALAGAAMLRDVSLLDQEYRDLLAVTPEQVRDAAALYLQPNGVSAVAYLPHGAGEDLTADVLRQAFEATAATPLAAVVAPPVPTPTPISTSRAGPRTVSDGGVIHVELPGVDLLVRAKSASRLATVGIYVPRTRFDPPALAGVGALTARAAVRGAGTFDAAGLAFAFEQLGGTLGPSVASDWLGFGTTVLSDRLAAAATLLDLVFTQPRLADADLEIERQLMTVEAAQVADDMFRYPFQLAFRAAFGDHGYGLPIGGLPETLPAIAAADVRRWHEQALLGARPVVVVVGDVTPERAAAELVPIFERYREQPATAAPEPSAWAVGDAPIIRAVPRSKAQSALAMVFPGPTRRDPARGVADVWAAIASGLGGRMFEALRERRSLAYTVLASAWPKARAGALVTYIATSPERELEARDAMLVELARFAELPADETELRRAVAYLSGQTQVGRQSGAAVAGEVLEAWIAGAGLAEVGDPTAIYRDVTAEQVQRLAVTYLDAARRAEGVIRGTGGTGAGVATAVSAAAR